MQIRKGLFFEEQAQWPVPNTLIQTPYHRKSVSRDSLTVHVAVLGAGKVIKRTWLGLTWNFCSNHHTNAKFTFLWCHILWGGDGLKSSDGHISYGKGERKWARKNAFHQPKGSSRKMEYRKKKICKWGIVPLHKTYIWKPVFSMGSIKSYC